jgi:hypothetical protein
MNEQVWKEVINEGGEGYNPYSITKKSNIPEWVRVDNMLDKIIDRMTTTSTDDPEYELLKVKKAIMEKTIDDLRKK